MCEKKVRKKIGGNGEFDKEWKKYLDKEQKKE